MFKVNTLRHHLLNPFRAALPGLLSLALTGAASGATLIWDSNGTTPPNPSDGGGAWMAVDNWWNGAANVTWSGTNLAVFGAGVDGDYQVNVNGLPYFATTNMWFRNSGYTLYSDTPALIGLNNPVGGYTNTHVRIDAGKTVTFGTNFTVTMAAIAGNGLYIGALSNSVSGTLNIENGATILNTNASTAAGSIYVDGVGTVVNVKTGGTIWLASTGLSLAVTIGQNAAANCTVNVQGGTITNASASGNNSGMILGNVGSATLNLDSGSISLAPAAFGLQIARSGAAAGSGTFNLNGGTLNVPLVRRGTISGGGTANFYFNGGTLKALATQAAFMNGLTHAYIRNGGAIVDDNGFALTIGQAIEHSDIGADNAIDGGFTKLGSGTLTLSNACSYTGPTIISGGQLRLTGSVAGELIVQPGTILSGSGSVGGGGKVNNTGTLSAGNALGTGNLTFGNLTFGNSPGDAQTVNVTVGTAIINVFGGLTNNGTTTINVSSVGSLAPGSYNLITYAGEPVTSGFVLGTKPLGSTLQYGLNSIDLVIPDSLKWTGVNSAIWDTTTTNWQWVVAGTPGKFANSVAVLMDDSLTLNPDITLNTSVSPGGVTFANEFTTYTLTGGGSIGGVAGLTKNGAGLLILGTANTYAGETTLLGSGILATTNGSAFGTGTLSLKSARTDSMPTVVLSGGITVTNPVVMDSTTGREAFYSTNGNNTLAGPITITGTTVSHLLFQNNGDPGSLFSVSNSITGPSFAGHISLRGATNALGLVAGQVTINSQFQINGSANWRVTSTSNTWTQTLIQGENGSLILGANDALATGARVTFAGNTLGALDLAGFSQTVVALDCASVTLAPGPVVGNSSITSDSLLRIASANHTFAGTLVDKIGGGTRKLSIQVLGGTTQTLIGDNTYSGTTTISGGTLTIGNGGTVGSISNTSAIINNGTITFNRSDAFVVPHTFTGTGTVSLLGGVIARPVLDTDLGQGTINVGSTQTDTSRVELTGGITLTNYITYRSRNYPASYAAHFVNVSGTNTLNPPGDIPLATGGNVFVLQSDLGHLVLTKGVTTTAAGPRWLALLGDGSGEVQGPLSTNMALFKSGSGVWTFSGSSPMVGPTLITAGTLNLSGSFTAPGNSVTIDGTLAGTGLISGPVTVSPTGTLAPGTSLGALTINNNLTLQGFAVMEIQRNGSVLTCDLATGISLCTYGGTLVVTNVGGPLQVGDTFKLFAATNYTGTFGTIIYPAGYTFADNLATDGTIQVLTTPTGTPPTLGYSVTGGNMVFTWPGSGFKLQTQTNTLAVGLSSNWSDVPGGNVSGVAVPGPIAGNPAVFFRLISTP